MSSQPKRARIDGGPPTRALRNCDLSTINDGLLCSRCSEPIAYLSEYAILKPCGCSTCLKCLINSHAARGKSLLECCGLQVTDHQFIKAERVPSSPSIANKIQGEAMSEEYAKRFRPYQFMMNSGYDEFKTMEGDQTLAVGAIWIDSMSPRHCSLLHKSDDGISQQYTDSLNEFFAFLHPLVVTPSITPYEKIPTQRPREFFDHAVDNYTPLMAVIYGLATGNPDPTET